MTTISSTTFGHFFRVQRRFCSPFAFGPTRGEGEDVETTADVPGRTRRVVSSFLRSSIVAGPRTSARSRPCLSIEPPVILWRSAVRWTSVVIAVAAIAGRFGPAPSGVPMNIGNGVSSVVNAVSAQRAVREGPAAARLPSVKNPKNADSGTTFGHLRVDLDSSLIRAISRSSEKSPRSSASSMNESAAMTR